MADLALLDRIHHTADAGYLCGNRQGCLKGTRKGVLWEIEYWLKKEQEQHIFWLNGLAGTGKSTIAQTFAERMFADGKLGASFFCSRDFADRSNLQAIFPTLAFQLAYRYPLFRAELLHVLRACPDVRQESLCSQMEKLIVAPLKAAHTPTLIIIDALDECKDEEPASAILSILSRYVDEIPDVKFFITGRPEPRIRSGFRLKSLLPITAVLKLHEVKPQIVDNDIKLFFQTQLTNIAENRSDCDSTGDWPSLADVETLCRKAAGFFIYAATVVKFIASKNHKPTKQLNLIISFPQRTFHEGRSGIDLLYTQILEQAVNSVHMDDKELYSSFRTVVGAVLLVFNPLSVEALSDLLRVSNISTTLRSLHSLLLVPSNNTSPIRTFHKSFPDFLTDQGRCTDHRFFVNPSIHHREVLLSCLNVMKEKLEKNICKLDDYVFLSEVEDLSARRTTYIGDTLKYACCFWTNHLVKIPSHGPDTKEVQRAIDKFFKKQLLSWIEVLSLMGTLNAGVYGLNNIQRWYMLVSCMEDSLENHLLMLVQTGVSCKWANDSQHLLLEHFDAICDSPSQIYHSALPFSPSLSWLREYYSIELSQEVRVVKGLPTEWGTCSRTVMLDDSPNALTCWKDIITVALKSRIIILDGITGSQAAVLSGHTDSVGGLTFSFDGASLVSGSHDKTIKLWDVQTGGIIKTFYGHTNTVYSVSISADCTTVASGSEDKTIRLWDIQTRECHYTIEQQGKVFSVSFSPTNPQHFISAFGGKVQQWNTNGHKINPAHDGSHVAFSLDGTQYISCQGADVEVRHSKSGLIMAKFQASSHINHCCFSPDGQLIAIGAGITVYIWDITRSDPHLIRTFIGHTNRIVSLTFSSPSSIISSSYDQSVKRWQIDSPSTDPAMIDPISIPLTSAPTKSVTLQAKDGITITSDSDGVVSIWDLPTGHCKASFQTPAKNPNQSDARLVDSRLIFIWRAHEKIHIWDVERGELLQEVNAPGRNVEDEDIGNPKVSRDGYVEDIKISGDGSKVFCLNWSSIQAWSLQMGEVLDVVEHELDYPESLIVDDSRVWIHSPWEEPEGWDFGIPSSSPVQLSNPPLPQLNDTKLWDTGLSRIRNTVTGNVVFQLAGRFAKPIDTQLDSGYLVARYGSGEVLILDFNHVTL